MTPIVHQVQMDAGDFVEMSTDEVRDLIADGFGPDNHCPVCGKHCEPNGQAPHMGTHKRLIGDLPPRVQPSKPKIKAKPKPKTSPPMSTTDACLALIMGVTGKDNIPVHLFADVSDWVVQTTNLIERMNR